MRKNGSRTFLRHNVSKAAEAEEIEAATAAWIAAGGTILTVPPAEPAPARPPARPYRLHPLHIPGGRLATYQGGTPWSEEWGDFSECQPDWY